MWDEIPGHKGLTIILCLRRTRHFVPPTSGISAGLRLLARWFAAFRAPSPSLPLSIWLVFQLISWNRLEDAMIPQKGIAISPRDIGSKSTTATPAAPECEHASLGHWQLVPGLPLGAHKDWNSIAKLVPGSLCQMCQEQASAYKQTHLTLTFLNRLTGLQSSDFWTTTFKAVCLRLPAMRCWIGKSFSDISAFSKQIQVARVAFGCQAMNLLLHSPKCGEILELLHSLYWPLVHTMSQT